jgi:nucleotide-binding universal stress UspA family protein
MDPTEIVVGTDGSPASHAAVGWAAGEALRRGAPLHVVCAYGWDWAGARLGPADELRRLAEREVEATVAEAVEQARRAAPAARVRGSAAVGEPVPVLLRAAEHAALLVVGSRGRGGFASLLLGSVSQRAATHANCPVTVVRGRHDAADGPVVVGVDGSAGATAALGTAFAAAAVRGAGIAAIRAYPPPSPPWGVAAPPPLHDPGEREAEEHAALAGSLARWREKYPDVAVEELVVRGSAARVLVGVSHTAQLVVVGSRGRGSLAGTLLGSVGLQLLHHADCPVVVGRA